MSWDRVIKSSQAIRTPVLSTLESRDFLHKAKKLSEMDEVSQILYKDSKQLNDRELELFKAEKRLVSELTNCHHIREDPLIKDGVQEWNEYIRHQEQQLQTMTSDTQTAVVDPVKRLLVVFPNIQTSIKKRDQLLVEYDKWQQKVEKLKKKERSGPNVVKLDSAKKSLKAAQEEFETLNSCLLSDMNSLYDRRAEYLTPSIQALISLQITQVGEGYKGYTELRERMSSSKDSEKMVADKFRDIKKLSIVSSVNT